MTSNTPARGAVVSRRRQEMRVLVASGLPILCGFGGALYLGREAARPPVVLSLSEPQLRVGLRGFSGREDWGRWTDGDEAALVFTSPLPSRFELTLEAWAYGPNVGLPVEVQVGGSRESLVLGPAPGTRKLSFRGASGRSLVFHIPRPASPRERGEGGDRRRLGIAVGRVSIRVPEGAP